jgi:hypothetical protein
MFRPRSLDFVPAKIDHLVRHANPLFVIFYAGSPESDEALEMA